MQSGLGQLRDDGTTLLVTREIRWFHRGILPVAISDWFAALDGDHYEEKRTDHYDVAAANRGAGVKYRDATHMDSKFLLSRRADLDLPGPFVGSVDDWVKISSPIADETDIAASQFLAVDKEMGTIAVWLASDRVAGCEIELVSIQTGGTDAWSICLETFGPPELRADAFQLGMRALADAPRPAVDLTSEANYGYPSWIASLALAG